MSLSSSKFFLISNITCLTSFSFNLKSGNHCDVVHVRHWKNNYALGNDFAGPFSFGLRIWKYNYALGNDFNVPFSFGLRIQSIWFSFSVSYFFHIHFFLKGCLEQVFQLQLVYSSPYSRLFTFVY